MFYDTHGDLVRPVRIDGEIREGYFVSIAGRVYSTHKRIPIRDEASGMISGIIGKVMPFDEFHRERKLRIQRGYVVVGFNSTKETKSISRLVCRTFNGDPPTARHHAGHRDDNPTNNHADNLIWQTAQENIAQKIERDRQAKGKDHGKAILTESDILAIRDDTRVARLIASEYNVSPEHINAIKRRKYWKHIT